MKNKIIVICLIFFILISISAVSAQNNNTDIISTTDNDDNAISINNIKDDNLSATTGSFADLNTKINGGSSTSIELDMDYAYSGSDTIKEGIVINRDNVTIDGKGHTIDAKGQSRILYVNSTTVYLKNIKFVNGNAEDGGAIYGYGDNLRVSNCTFEGCTASSSGGAIYSFPTTLAVFMNSTFTNNGAKWGGAITTEYGYKQYIVNCTFDSNHADNYGGAVFVYGKQATTERPYADEVNVIGSTFTANKAPKGEAISNFISAKINITNSILLGNVENLIDNDVYFAFANYNWFGNTYDNRSVRPNIHKSIEMDNWLYMDLVPDLATSSATVSINNIYDASTGKTGTYTTSRLPSIAVDVDADKSTLGADKVILDHSGKATFDFIFLNDTTFTASYKTSSISKMVKAGSFTDLQRIINSAKDGDEITLDRDYIYIKGLDIMTQGVQMSDKHNIVIDGKGHTVNAGGNTRVFAVDKDSYDITFKNLIIVNGYLYSDSSGAGLYILSDNTRLVNCTFINNTANSLAGGAAVFVHASHVSITGSSFIANTHLFATAGAVLMRGNDLSISNTLFENNSAVAYAGALELYDDCDITNCTFKNNTASHGGATFNYGHANFIDCTFTDNHAVKNDIYDDYNAGAGGAVYAMNTTLTGCTFTYNEGSTGAAIFVAANGTDVDKCIFINNTEGYNGVICSAAQKAKVSNSIFLNNNAGYYDISCIYDGIVVEYNWFGNIWYKNKWQQYNTTPPVSNLAKMDNWLFLNATDITFDDKGNLKTSFTLLEYDNKTKNVIQYDINDLPEITLSLSSQNLTLSKNVAKLGQTIEGNSTNYKGSLCAEYENVKYEIPFKHLIETTLEVNSTMNIFVDSKNYINFNLIPYEYDAIPFLISNKRLTITSNDTSIAKIDGSYVRGVKVGLALITIKYNGLNVIGEDKYTPSNATILVNVTRIPTHIEFIYDAEDMGIGESGNLYVSARDYKNKSFSGSTLTYTNNNESVLRLAGSSFRTLEEGLANVTVSFAGNSKYEPCSLDVTFNVAKRPVTITVETNELEIYIGQHHFLGPRVREISGALLNCSSNDTSVATIGDNGEVVAIGRGMANLTIRYDGNDRYKATETYVIVNVIDFETHIEADSEIEMNITDIKLIHHILKNANGKTISVPIHDGNQLTTVYSSNDTSVVTVDESGYLNATGAGVANVTIHFNGYMEFQPSSASVLVKVTIPKNDIIVKPEIDLHVGEYKIVNATLEHKPFGLSPSSFIYEVNDTDVVRITTAGSVTGYSEGTAKITVRYESNRYLPSNATVIVRVTKGDTKITAPDSISLYVDETKYVNANLTSLWENKNITGMKYESSNNKVAKVDRYGFITAVGIGQANISVKYDGSNKYNGYSTNVLVNVDYVPTTIDVGKTFSLIIGENETMVAKLNPSYAGKLNFTSSDESIVTVDENGLVSTVAAGQANITISFAGDKKYASATRIVLVTVATSSIPTSIDVNDTIELYVDDTVKIGAEITPSNAGNLTYASSNSSIVSVDANGTVTAVDLGEAVITIKYTDSKGRFLPSNATVLVKVSAIPTTMAADGPITINLTENSTVRYTFSHPGAGNVEFIIGDSNIATVNNGVVVANKVGKTNLTIKFAGNKHYLPSNATVLVNVVDVPTRIDADDVSLNVSQSASIRAKLTPNVGKLTYTSSNPSVVTVDDAGKVTGLKVGEANITIKFEASGKYREATKTIKVKVSDVETSIDAEDIDLNVTESVFIDATLTPRVGKLTYSSSNSSIVTVSDSGLVRGVKVGEANVIIKFEADGKYREATKTIKVRVFDVATSIEASDITVNVTEKASIDASLTPNVGKLTYESTDSSVVTVDKNGVVKGITKGEADIIIRFDAVGKYRQTNKTVHVKVTEVPTEIKVNDTISLFVDDAADIGAILMPLENAKLSYASNDSSVVSVDSTGRITAIKQGTALITVSYAGEGKYSSSNNKVTVTVSRIPTEISLNSIELEIGEARLLNPVVSPVSQKNLIYSSNDSSVVEVDDSGYISAVSGGKALITITYPGDEKYLPSNYTFTLSIDARVTTIDVERDIEIGFNETKDLDAHVMTKYYATDLPMTYESSNPKVVSVDENGRITGKEIGNATITIRFAGAQSFAPSSATVNVVVTTRTTHIDVLQEELSLYVDDDANVGAYLVDGPKDAKLTYTSSNLNVVRVDSNGKITAVNEGSAVITANYAGDVDYHSSSATVNVTVSKLATKIVADNTFEMKVFETINLNAVLTPQDAILSYSSSDDETASVDASGRLTAKTAGNVVVTIRFAGDRKYLPSQKQVIVVISKVPTSLNLSDITLYSGEEFKLKNILIPSDAPSRYLSFESGDFDIFDVDSKGVLTAFQEGITDLFIEYKGNDAYLPCNATVIVKVIKKTLTSDDCRFDVEVADDAGEATFTIHVPEDAEGGFYVTVDGDVYGEEITDGIGVITVDELAPGDHEVTMRYAGSEMYYGVTNKTTIHIYRIKIDKNKDVSVLYTQRATYKVHLTSDTQALEGKNVTFKINGKTYYAITDVLGYASVKLPKLPAKTYTITASYKGIKVTNKITSKHIIVAKDLKTKKTKDLKVKVTLNKVNKKYLSNKKVTLRFKGNTYTAKTNSKGVVTFTIKKSVFASLKVGKSYTYKVSYSSDKLSKKIKIVK